MYNAELLTVKNSFSYLCFMDPSSFALTFLAVAFFGFVLVIAIILYWSLFKRGNKKAHFENPYIKAHKYRHANNRWYDEYIQWMSKNNDDIPPFEKVKTPEDIAHEKMMEDLFNS